MKKRIYQVLFTFCIVLLYHLPHAAAVTDDTGLSFESGGISYKVYVYMNPEEEATVVSGAVPYEGDIVIPDSVTFGEKTYKVARIGNYAFYENSALTSITLPPSINYIGTNAFRKCSGLKGVYITDINAWCHTEFGSNPLDDAHNLYLDGTLVRCLQIPPGITSIPDQAFYGATCIESVVFPESLDSIGMAAFALCTGIRELIIPNPVKSIGNAAFDSNTALERVWLPSTLRNIGGYAFSGCKRLREMWVKVPYGTQVDMGRQPFYSSGSGDEGSTLYVPESAVSSYNNGYWLSWKNIIGMEQLDISLMMKFDLFKLPYGKYDSSGEWTQVEHLNKESSYIFYGNDINEENYADLTGCAYLKLHGKKGQVYFLYVNGDVATEIELDDSGTSYVDLSQFGETVHLRGIRIAQASDSESQETIAADAYARVIRILGNDEGRVVSGTGVFPESINDYPFYDASGLTKEMSLSLANPNALVIKGSQEVTGTTNLITRSIECKEGLYAPSLSISDSCSFCYDFSVRCPDVTFTRGGLSAEDLYVTVILPFDVDPAEGLYRFVDCDGKNVNFKTPDSTVPAYTPIMVDVKNLDSIALQGENLSALMPNGTFNLSGDTNDGRKYGFVSKRQESVSLTDNAEVKDYDVYGYSITTHRFVRAVNTFTINPFRPIFLLPKTTVDQSSGRAATSGNPSALTIVIDGKEIGNGTTGIDEVMTREHEDDGTTYNLMGVPVGPGYRGIGIRNGKKIIIK